MNPAHTPLHAGGQLHVLDLLQMAVFALRGNWLRSLLTALGVIIGIAAVIVMVAIGGGTRAELDRLITGLGANRIDIAPNLSRVGGAVQDLGSLFTLSSSDVEALREQIPEIAAISGVLQGRTTLVHGDANWTTSWYGVDADYFGISHATLAEGELWTPEAAAGALPEVVIGATVRHKLFAETEALGQTIRIGSTEYRVVGVLAPKGIGMGGNDLDDGIWVPLDTGRRRLLGRLGLPPQRLMNIVLGVARAEDLAYVEAEAARVLREQHRLLPGMADDFQVRNLTQIVSTRHQTTELMSVLLAVVAGVSLLVGGIGIMNIMLVSVTERTREIGLRLAIGATPRDIRRQFLAEAVVLSVGGGLLGIALGLALTELTLRLSELPIALGSHTVLLAAVVAVGTGLFFGYYPAHRAARLDPIEALRQ